MYATLSNDVEHRCGERITWLGSSAEPAGYMDGVNRYQFVKSSPILGTDPLGLYDRLHGGARPSTPPSPSDQLPISGSGTLSKGKYEAKVIWSVRQVSSTHWPEHDYNVFYTAKIKGTGKACRQYMFIDYGETSTNNNGADRYRETDRGDRLDDPYGYSIIEQQKVNAGNAYDGAFTDLYDNKWPGGGTADAVDIDQAGIGKDQIPYDHVLTSLVVASDRSDFSGALPARPTDTILGGIHWEWHVDAAGKVTGTARLATAKEIQSVIHKSLFPPYNNKFLNSTTQEAP